MIKSLLFLTALGLVHGLKVPHPDCPQDELHHLLPHESDCTKYYYCENGDRFVEPRNCAPGTEFSFEQQVCTHPDSAKCTIDKGSGEDNIPDDSPAPGPDPQPNPPPQPQPNPTTEASQGTTDCERFENGCPVDFNIDEFFEHETYCRLFYRCVFGQKVTQKCARGTVFNILIKACDRPENVDRTCEDYESSEEDIPDNDDESREIDFLENGCPVDSSIAWLLPHEKYCNVFYQCNHGDKLWTICPGSTQFNPIIQACDHAHNVDCEHRDSLAVATTQAPAPIVPSTPRPDFEINENGCPIDSSINWLLPHDDCTKFYHCVHGNLVESSCPAGLHFSPTKQICDNPATAGCANGPCSDATDCSKETSGEDVTEDAVDDVTDEEADDVSEDKEEVTEGEEEAVTEDEAVSEEETVTEEEAVSEEEAVTEGEVVTEADEDETREDIVDDDDEEDCDKTEEDKKCEEECHVKPWAHDDCDKFWICYDNKAKLIVCSNGLYFNPVTKTCDFECNVDCDSSRARVSPQREGLSMYIPWEKLDHNAKQLIKLIKAH